MYIFVQLGFLSTCSLFYIFLDNIYLDILARALKPKLIKNLIQN